MLRPAQIVVCACLATVMWAGATAAIHLDPRSVGEGWRGDFGFGLGIPTCWLSIWLTCRLARLAPDQIPFGCLVVLGDAMLLDSVALRWFPWLYGTDQHVLRLGAAWLLWGYGIGAWLALLFARKRRAVAAVPAGQAVA